MNDQPAEATDHIELRLPATAEHLPIARSVAVNIAMRADFDVDAISDLELAVDEACSELIVRAVDNATLSCRFILSAETIGFAANVLTDDDRPPGTSTFGWRVLDTLTDTAEAWIEPGQDTRHLVHIAIAKQRQVTPG